MTFKKILIGALVCLWAAGCSEDDTMKIGAHKFLVPKDYLDNSIIPWLPRPEPESFSFVLVPSAPPEERISALVELKSKVCGKDPVTEFEQPVCGHSFLWEESKWVLPSDLRKFAPEEDGGTQWQYIATDPGTNKTVVVATCFGPVNDKGGLCRSAVRYGGDLFVSVGYSEEKIPDLSKIIAHTRYLLDRWEYE